MSGKILLSFKEFIDKLVPVLSPKETEPVHLFKTADFRSIPQKAESDMYEASKLALNHDWLLPHDVAVSMSNKPGKIVGSNQKAHCGLYTRNDSPIGSDFTSWSSMELLIECKTSASQYDPFEDDERGPESLADSRKHVLGQIIRYAVLVFDSQHRTHHFTLLILGPMARLIRWDRSGILVTHKFDYTMEPEKLAQFLWRFGRMSPSQRGHDPSAVRVMPGSAEYHHVHSRASTPSKAWNGTVVGEHARDMFRKSLFITYTVMEEGKSREDITIPAPLWRLTVYDASGSRDFLVGLPHTTAGSLRGRGTRTYVALDAQDMDGPFVYLKDTWRVDHERIEREGKNLALLNNNSEGGPVDGVPTLLYHGDVGDQVTYSQVVWWLKYPNASPEACLMKTHRHYRLVVKEVCLSMSDFRCFIELVSMVIDCIDAHGHAYTRKGLLHCDISAGNVLIYPKIVEVDGQVSEQWVGLLADWELAKQVRTTDTKDASRQPDRIGTWQFASAMALDNPKNPWITVQDDMESFFHLLLYFAIRYLPHNCENVREFMDEYFDGYHTVKGVYYGGKEKLRSMKHGILTTPGVIPLEFYVPKQSAQPAVSRGSASPIPQDAASDASAVCSGRPDQEWSNSACPTIADEGGKFPRNSSHIGPEVTRSPVTSDGAYEPLKRHPMNKILAEFLIRIKAHYALHHAPETQAWAASSQSTMGTGTSQPPYAASIERRRSIARLRHAEMGITSASTLIDSEIPDMALVDKQQKELAARLGDHEDIMAFLVHYILAPDIPWPDYYDRTSDQLTGDCRSGVDSTL
ncbi:hypothetical protein BN946_scf184907.g4 [Trametes cinnabarina]|uniref:Fungal-type protein kinase domain-containing protein n=1 Tax=Pycnoporus cinnabarinus TaxID=5643 RepID=A0A060T0F5_PYCCI|nr:hypothetical protein BN946_scf184907.g4 [Trametes cinnabarina]